VIAAPYGPARAVLGTAADLVELDAAAWLDAIQRVLLESAPVRAARIAAGRAWAAQFDWDRAVDDILALCAAHARVSA
jgi:hypothetical protein